MSDKIWPKTILEIEKRWKDRFDDCETPPPSGYEKIGYVIDIYDLLKYIKSINNWKEIDSCPKSGEWFLACGDYFSHAYLAAFSVRHGIIDYEGNKVQKTTHWMPLPKPPQKGCAQ